MEKRRLSGDSHAALTRVSEKKGILKERRTGKNRAPGETALGQRAA